MSVPTATTSKNPKTPQKKISRPSKRPRTSAGGNSPHTVEEKLEEGPEREMLNSMQWTCVCADIDQWVTFAAKLKKSKHSAEKELHSYIIEDVMPALEAAEEV